MSAETVLVHLLGKEYQMGCPPGEEQALKAAAEFLDQKMREIRETGKVIGLERIAIMAAMNLSHELIKAQEENTAHTTGSSSAINRINDKLDSALNRYKQLEI